MLDFGLAKLMADADTPEEDAPTLTSHASVSAPGTIAGTAAYMSPEQATGGKVDARSDVFSFGAMLYEMVTGVRAFTGASLADRLVAVVRAQPQPPSEIISTVPSDLQKAILRCLRKDPERRFQHISDVRVALQEIKEESESGTAAATGPNTRRVRFIGALVASAVLVAAFIAWLLWRQPEAVIAPLRVVPLTALNGNEGDPSFSPDGEQVAFSWDGGVYGTSDIYVKLVGSPEVRQLTTDPALDATPSWSPDGRQIAFLRFSPGGAEGRIHLVSPLGGIASMLSDFPTWDQLAWSPDCRMLAAGRLDQPGNHSTGIFAIPIDGGEPRALTQTMRPASDVSPAFSPDGRRLAYMCCPEVNRPTCNVCILDLDATYRAAGATRRLTADPVAVGGLRWSRDGHSIIYGTQPFPSLAYLWRIAADGNVRAERIEVAGVGAMDPAPALARNRLAFTRSFEDIDVYQFRTGRPPDPVVVSPSGDWQGQISPDGRQIAFSTSHSGEGLAIWVAAADGSAARPLLPGMHRWHGGPTWSPDGRRIAFDWRDEAEQNHIWTIDARGGPPQQLTRERGHQILPTWSRDGRTIYFSAGARNGRNVWRVAASGGPPTRVTVDGSGVWGMESADGTSVYFR